MRLTQWVLVVLVSLAAAVGGFWAARVLLVDGGVEPGDPAPAFRITDLHGQPRTLEEFRGKLLLVNFWASWCAPCVAEIPLLVEAQALFGARGLQIIGPALDEPQGVKPFIARFGMNYPVMADFAAGDAANRALGNVQGYLPYSVLISREGVILHIKLGALKRGELHALIEQHLRT